LPTLQSPRKNSITAPIGAILETSLPRCYGSTRPTKAKVTSLQKVSSLNCKGRYGLFDRILARRFELVINGRYIYNKIKRNIKLWQK